MRMLMIAFPALALATGCVNVNEDNFFEKLGKAQCEWMERCDAADFYEEWDDKGECRDDQEDYAEDYEDYLDDCDFDEDKGKDCLKAFNDSCKDSSDDDHFEDCWEAWDC